MISATGWFIMEEMYARREQSRTVKGAVSAICVSKQVYRAEQLTGARLTEEMVVKHVPVCILGSVVWTGTDKRPFCSFQSVQMRSIQAGIFCCSSFLTLDIFENRLII